MKSLRGLLLLSILLLAIPFAASAQGNTQILELEGGVQITVPANWDVDDSDPDGIIAGDADWEVIIFTPASLDRQGDDTESAVDAVTLLREILEAVSPGFVDRNIVKVPLDERTAAAYMEPESDGAQTRWVVVPIGDSYGLLAFVGQADEISTQGDAMLEIIASFDVADAESAVPVNAGTGVPCTVSADAANSAALRVGPGENRSSIAFLPANTNVTVTGRIELEDGSVWFQLDKTEAAPQGTAASELWVNEEDVATSGDCDRVGETNAPPVIPISVAPPAATVAPGEPAPPPAQAGAIPASGAWTLTLAPITNASCLGYENVAFNTSEVYTRPTFGGSLSVVDSNSFIFDGSLFRRNGNSNSFSGAIEIGYEGGGSVTTQFRFDLVTSTSMTGQMVANYTYDDGTPCSDTVTFTARRG